MASNLVLQKLDERDSQIQPYIWNILENYNILYSKNRKLEDELSFLKKENLMYKQTTINPQVLQDAIDSKEGLQKKLTQSYEDYKKVQDSLLNRVEEVLRLNDLNNQLVNQSSKYKQRASNFEKNLRIKENSLIEIAQELTEVMNTRNQLLVARDNLQDEVTKLRTENNQV